MQGKVAGFFHCLRHLLTRRSFAHLTGLLAAGRLWAAGLPCEIWQRVFTFLPSDELGSARLVCKCWATVAVRSVVAVRQAAQPLQPGLSGSGRFLTVAAYRSWQVFCKLLLAMQRLESLELMAIPATGLCDVGRLHMLTELTLNLSSAVTGVPTVLDASPLSSLPLQRFTLDWGYRLKGAFELTRLTCLSLGDATAADCFPLPVGLRSMHLCFEDGADVGESERPDAVFLEGLTQLTHLHVPSATFDRLVGFGSSLQSFSIDYCSSEYFREVADLSVLRRLTSLTLSGAGLNMNADLASLLQLRCVASESNLPHRFGCTKSGVFALVFVVLSNPLCLCLLQAYLRASGVCVSVTVDADELKQSVS